MLGRDDFAPAGQHCKAIAVNKASRVWPAHRLLGRLKPLPKKPRDCLTDRRALHLRNLARLKQHIGFKIKGSSHCGIIAS